MAGNSTVPTVSGRAGECYRWVALRGCWVTPQERKDRDRVKNAVHEKLDSLANSCQVPLAQARWLQDRMGQQIEQGAPKQVFEDFAAGRVDLSEVNLAVDCFFDGAPEGWRDAYGSS